MNKIRVIDLLNKIANGEQVPKKIHIKQFQCDFIFNGRTYLSDEKEPENIYWCLHSEALNYEVEILEEKKTIDDLNLTLEEIEAFDEARQIFLKLNNEEDKQTFIKLLLGEGTYQRWLDYLKSKGDE